MKRNSICRVVLSTLCLLTTVVSIHAAPRVGFAVAARTKGKAKYHGPEGKGEYTRGVGLPQAYTIETGPESDLCCVLTPGVILGVGENTELTFTRLETVSEGLPEGTNDLKRFVSLDIEKGSIRVNGGSPDPNMQIEVTTPAGTIRANGGLFEVVVSEGQVKIVVEEGEVIFIHESGEIKAGPGEMIVATKTEASKDKAPDEGLGLKFDSYDAVVDELAPIVLGPSGADLDALGNWLGLGGIGFVGGPDTGDISPTTRF